MATKINVAPKVELTREVLSLEAPRPACAACALAIIFKIALNCRSPPHPRTRGEDDIESDDSRKTP